jgi:hypothetical protein
MKAKLVAVLLLVGLMTTGSTCINDGFLVAVNLPINPCFAINGGTNTNFSGSSTIVLGDQIDQAYRDHIKSARYYDIRVSVLGAYGGNVNGTATINGINLLTFTGAWSDFATPQSLLGTSPHITPQQAGINEIVRVLNLYPSQPNISVTLAASGTVSQSPVPSGLSVCVEVLAQADAEVK